MTNAQMLRRSLSSSINTERPLHNLPKNETFEKRSILFKVKEGEDFNRRNTREVFRGLNSKSDAEIGQKGAFFKGLTELR
jgi:hypothetical protein